MSPAEHETFLQQMVQSTGAALVSNTACSSSIVAAASVALVSRSGRAVASARALADALAQPVARVVGAGQRRAGGAEPALELPAADGVSERGVNSL